MGNFPSEEPFDPEEDEDESMAYESGGLCEVADA
jgi:hypothetical protein